MSRFTAFSAMALLLAGCASGGLAPLGTVAGGAPEEDERRMWERAREVDRALEEGGKIYPDPALTEYLEGVAARLTPREVRASGPRLRVRILSDPLINAFALPTGSLYVHTGLLAKLDNEAQLAAILGHEMTHVLHRHAIQEQRRFRTQTAVVGTVGVLTTPVFYSGILVEALGALATVVAVTGYSREHEREADSRGFELMVQAGYDPAEGPRPFALLKQELEEQGEDEPFFLGSHPRVAERLEAFEELLRSRYPGVSGEVGADRYQAHVQRLVLDDAEMDIALGRMQVARRTLARYRQRHGPGARDNYLLAESYRGEVGPQPAAVAESAYRAALAHDPGFAEAYRGLGVVLYKQRRLPEAREALEIYLRLRPTGESRGFVEQMVREIGARGDR